VLIGGDGDDRLRGEAGNDILQGGRGVDRLDAGPDTDTCTDPANEPGTAIGCEYGP
jgi:Ca2+-binding RTX toxin-like protein